MALSPRLEVRQSQSLVMTPQLMQAIKLLQLSNLDLLAYVDNELEQNPLLERGDSSDAPSEDLPTTLDRTSETENTSSDSGENDDWLQGQLEVSAEGIASKMDADAESLFPEDKSGPSHEPGPVAGEQWPSAGGARSEEYNLESFVADSKSLGDHLTDQLALAISDPAQRLVGLQLINQLDDDGYLRIPLLEIAERLEAPLDLVEAVLVVCQTLEPSGVFSRNLAECLAIQLRDKNRFDPAMAALIDNIDLLAKRDFTALRKCCGVDDDDLSEMIQELRALDPKPGSAFATELVQPVVPDVHVKPAADGSWAIELNSDTLPKVLINQHYYSEVSKHARNDKDKAYLTDCFQTANWLVKSLDQRARTILKVATEIVRQQDAFLTYGIQHLRPLNLRAIAEAIEMHESTVSRVTSNKYISTPRGIFELKYFFTAAIASTEGGDAHSAEAVRHKIRQLIDAEQPKSILSDDTLVKMLKSSGIDIARRTVAKYRESLKIPSSVQRRREKNASLG
ncbi:MAG: RNA polymerase factor sigma-54 [Stappiaceae bacterium]